MTVSEIVGLLRRHLIALVILVIAGACLVLVLKRTPMMYQESGTITLAVNLNSSPYNDSLINTTVLISGLVMSPQGQEQVAEAGGTADYNVAPVNNYNMQFPDYYEPSMTVTASSVVPAVAHDTFTATVRLIDHDLAVLQTQAGVLPAYRIGADLIGDTGPIAQPGSPKRVYAGLLVLMIVAAFSLAIFFDRHTVSFATALRSTLGRLRGRRARHATRMNSAG